MANLILENVPVFIKKTMGNKTSFNNILGIYWDGMDWCQFNEVIPTKDDIDSIKKYKTDLSKKDGKTFLKNLISK